MRFLRFEVGGASALLWMLLFLSPYLNIAALTQVDAMKLFAVVFSSITLSIPLGNYIHQFTDSVLNPFGRRRLMIWRRACVEYIERELGSSDDFNDGIYQAILVFSKAYNRSTSLKGPHRAFETTADLRVEILREEISNRYSYYYARIENGAVAPIFGNLLACLLLGLFEDTQYIAAQPAFSPWWLLIVWMGAAIPLLWRLPQLFRELDDLEVALVRLQKDVWPIVESVH